MGSWAVRGVMAAFAIFLVIATVPRSNLTPAPTATPSLIAAASEAPIAAKVADACRGLDDSGASFAHELLDGGHGSPEKRGATRAPRSARE